MQKKEVIMKRCIECRKFIPSTGECREALDCFMRNIPVGGPEDIFKENDCPSFEYFPDFMPEEQVRNWLFPSLQLNK